jgi:hypothetical protein
MTRIQIVFDSADPHILCKFWAELLHHEVERHEDQIRQLVAAGHATEDDTAEFEGTLVWKTAAACSDPNGVLPRLLFQQVPEPKTVKDRIHVDIQVGDERRDAEVERAKALGATFLWHGQQGPHPWVTLADPEGNEFCIS